MFEEWLMHSILEWFEVDMDKNDLLKFETQMPLDLYKHFKKRINKYQSPEIKTKEKYQDSLLLV
jgi:hemerythrin superfamily protein